MFGNGLKGLKNRTAKGTGMELVKFLAIDGNRHWKSDHDTDKIERK